MEFDDLKSCPFCGGIAKDDKKYNKNINSLETDEEKWEWILNNKDKTTIYCDNDDNFAKIKGEDDLLRFDEYIGNSYGIIDLFKALNIKVEFV